MTIGALSRRTGIPVKALRTYEDMGLIYTVGRSPGNYRLFDDEADNVRCPGAASAVTRGRGRITK
jgi:DNA-binding transcriptional MerR regulator